MYLYGFKYWQTDTDTTDFNGTLDSRSTFTLTSTLQKKKNDIEITLYFKSVAKIFLKDALSIHSSPLNILSLQN